MPQPRWSKDLLVPEQQQRPLRLEGCDPSHTIRGMYYSAILERVRRGGGDPRRAIAEAKVTESDFSMLGHYPLAGYLRLQTACGRELVAATDGATTMEEAVYFLGRSAIEIFFESLAGRTFKALAGKNIHRFMKAGPSAYSYAVEDKARRAYAEVSERSAELTYQGDVLGPCHHAGVIDAALSITGVEYQLEIRQATPTDFAVRARW